MSELEAVPTILDGPDLVDESFVRELAETGREDVHTAVHDDQEIRLTRHLKQLTSRRDSGVGGYLRRVGIELIRRRGLLPHLHQHARHSLDKESKWKPAEIGVEPAFQGGSWQAEGQVWCANDPKKETPAWQARL